jgi:hypothetical protein
MSPEEAERLSHVRNIGIAVSMNLLLRIYKNSIGCVGKHLTNTLL